MVKRLLMALPGLVLLVALGGPVSTNAADAAPAAQAPPIESVSVDGVLYSLEEFEQYFGDQSLDWVPEPGGGDEERLIAFTTEETRQAAEAAWVEERVAAILRNNPGSQRIGANEVELDEGVVMAIPSPWCGTCSTGYLCLFEHSDFCGDKIRFAKCQDRNLGEYRMEDNVRRWNDKVSSIINAQFGPGGQARFYNYDGSGDPMDTRNQRFILALPPGHQLRNLSRDESGDGGNADNKIDIVHVCDIRPPDVPGQTPR